MNIELEHLLSPVRDIAVAAGTEILDIYNTTFDVVEKTDGSPLTTADSRAHELICRRLQELTPNIPVLSEESSTTAFEERREWNRFWLVDPLDGTKEFINRNGEFTVNIALVENTRPVLGVVYTPVSGITHQGARGSGAQRVHDGVVESIRCRPFDRGSVCLVASRSHSGAEVAEYQRALEQEVEELHMTSMGSALKICLVAEGSADIYPRLGPTSEWDTAASHCVLLEAGGRLCDTSGNELRYNKHSLLNPWFLAIGDPAHDWLRYLKN